MRVPSKQIHEQLATVFRAWGMSGAHAETTAQMMVETDLRGVDSHGISMLPTYDKEFRDDLTIFSGLSHPEVDGGHPTERCYLTAAPRPRADTFKNTISLDQYAIEKLVPDTRFGSLALSSSSSRGLSFTRASASSTCTGMP